MSAPDRRRGVRRGGSSDPPLRAAVRARAARPDVVDPGAKVRGVAGLGVAGLGVVRLGVALLAALLLGAALWGTLAHAGAGAGTADTAPDGVPNRAPDGAPHLRVLTDDGDVLVDLSLAVDPSWEVRWNHSVTGVLVSDYYRFEGGRMLLVASHTPAYDAGLGHIPGRGVETSDGHHGYWITGIDEPVPGNAYALYVGSAAVDHRIVHGGRVYSLSAAAAHRRVTIEVVGR